MTTFRCFVELITCTVGESFSLSDSDDRHALKSLRLNVGDSFQAIDRKTARTFIAIIKSVDPKIKAELREEIASLQSSSRLGSISFALCKGKRNDLVVEKAAELGAKNILLWQAERSIVRIKDQKDISHKLSHWQAIAESGSKQSKREDIPDCQIVKNAQDLIEAVNKLKETKDIFLFCSLNANAKSFNEIQKPDGMAHIIIGPEGDFSPQEEALFIGSGFIPITLGINTLRSETAAIASMGLIHALWSL